MDGREQRIYEEASALWREVFGESPPPRIDGEAMLELITHSLTEVSYDRLRSPHLRPSTITGPKRSGGRAASHH